MKSRLFVCTFAITMLAFLGTTAANDRVSQAPEPVHGVIDVLNLFPQVGPSSSSARRTTSGFPWASRHSAVAR